MVGLVVGQMAVIVRQRRRDAAESRVAVESLYRVAEQAARDPDVEHLAEVVRAELTGLLSLTRCSFRPGPPPDGIPVLEPSGWMDAGNIHRYTQTGEQLPGAGLAIPVRTGGELQGHVMCIPVPDSSVPLGRRRVAITLADQFALALAAASAKGRTALG